MRDTHLGFRGVDTSGVLLDDLVSWNRNPLGSGNERWHEIQSTGPNLYGASFVQRNGRLFAMRILVTLAISTGLLLGPTLTAQQPAPTKVTSVEGIDEYRLSNGMQVL